MICRILKYIICFSLVIALALGSFQSVYADTSFTDFTDVDADDLIDVTSQYSNYELMFGIDRKLVIDSAVSYVQQMQFDVLGSHTIAFTGSYYDNTITSMTACTSSSYQYNTQSHTIDGVMITEPTLFGSIGYQNQSAFLNVAMNVSVQSSAGETVTTNSFSNESQACALLGMNDGDGAIDGTVLLEAGYIKKTVSYNDGSATPHTATFYVPGPEDLNFETDDLEELVENIVVNVLNNITFDYHFRYDFYLTGSDEIAHAFPSYGVIKSYTYLPLMFGSYEFLTSEDPAQWLSDNEVYWDGNSEDHTYFERNNNISYRLTDNRYTSNQSDFYWFDTTNPHWFFRSKQFRQIGQLSNGTSNITATPIVDQTKYNSINGGYNYGHNYVVDEWYRITSNDVALNSNLTAGALLPYGMQFNSKTYYKLQDTSRLNLFNQLGSFLNTQFNRVVNTIANISGGSNDLADDISQDYNIDIDVSINNDVANLYDRDDDIDLTLPEYNLDSNNNLSLLRDVPLETVNLFFDNKLGYLILLPIIIAIIGRVIG